MDFRVASLLEARECLRQVEAQKPVQPEFWANLLGAIANATLAAVSDQVARGLETELIMQDAKKRRLQSAVQKRIRDKLKT